MSYQLIPQMLSYACHDFDRRGYTPRESHILFVFLVSFCPCWGFWNCSMGVSLQVLNAFVFCMEIARSQCFTCLIPLPSLSLRPPKFALSWPSSCRITPWNLLFAWGPFGVSEPGCEKHWEKVLKWVASASHLLGGRKSLKTLKMLQTAQPPTEVQNLQTPQKCSGECSGRCQPETGCSGKCLERRLSSLFWEETPGSSTFPSTSPSTPFLAGTSPSTLPSTFGGWGFCASVGGRPVCN